MVHRSHFLQGAQDTIESLQTQVLDLEIKLNQAKAAFADSQHVNRQDILKLQEQLQQAELRAASKSDSDSALKAITLDVHQLRSELQTQVSAAAAAAAASQAGTVANLQEKLQQAEAKAASSVELSSKVDEMSQELDQLQNAVREAQDQSKRLKSSAAEAEEEHKAALQVMLNFYVSSYQSKL